MSDHEWHDIARYNLVMPQKSMIKLYNIMSISHHYTQDNSEQFIMKGFHEKLQRITVTIHAKKESRISYEKYYSKR